MPAAPIIDPATLDPGKVLLDRAGIDAVLPHRGQMALVDAVCFHDPQGPTMAGWRDVQADEFWVPGHFPGNPLLPGVVLVEACAQLSLVCYKMDYPEVAGRLVVFGGIDKVRFRGATRPGDRVFLIARLVEMSRRGARAQNQALVNGKIVYEGEILAIAT
jgi:3-hydroxyacyl-[acyl-carrier-protein] dehydratase